jgi:streptomycin 6-kinase
MNSASPSVRSTTFGVHELDVSDLVRQRAANNSNAGRRWLAELPGVVADLTERWQLTLGAPLTGGTAGYVVEATDASGRSCVLKVAMPLDMDDRETFARSVRAHALAAGRGCAELLAHDLTAPAMLLERLGPNLNQLGLTVPQILEAITATLPTFWRPIGIDAGLRTGEAQARWLSRYIADTWGELGQPCERAVIDRALALCERRAAAFDPTRAVLVHGDAHGWNTLDAGGGTYKFVDVEGLCSEREHDLSVAMREYNEPLVRGDTPRLVRDRAAYLAQRCGVDPQIVWEWGFIERVSTGLANVRDFDNDDGTMFLEVARRCL